MLRQFHPVSWISPGAGQRSSRLLSTSQRESALGFRLSRQRSVHTLAVDSRFPLIRQGRGDGLLSHQHATEGGGQMMSVGGTALTIEAPYSLPARSPRSRNSWRAEEESVYLAFSRLAPAQPPRPTHPRPHERTVPSITAIRSRTMKERDDGRCHRAPTPRSSRSTPRPSFAGRSGIRRASR